MQEHLENRKKVLVAMSGGVDSSVVAVLLKKQGYDVIGVHLQLWDHGAANLERFGGRCCSLVDAQDARRVCDRWDIPFYVVNAEEVFKEQVVDYFVHEYLKTRTPNPCVECNSHIKFYYLFQKADELGCEWVATGHYAQVSQDPGISHSRLYKAVDPQKDQTYFLFGLTQKALRRTLMPLGCFTKMQVRQLAQEFELAVAQKPDSQEICFIGTEGYKTFIENRVSADLRPGGVIRTLDGLVVGEHDGLHRYTIGQKKGLNLKSNSTQEYFVVGFDLEKQVLLVGPEENLFQREIFASDVNWIIPPEDQVRPLRCHARVRSRHEEAPCWVTCFEDHRVHIAFDEPQRAMTPGQAVVFYREQETLGGGFIQSVGGQQLLSGVSQL